MCPLLVLLDFFGRVGFVSEEHGGFFARTVAPAAAARDPRGAFFARGLGDLGGVTGGDVPVPGDGGEAARRFGCSTAREAMPASARRAGVTGRGVGGGRVSESLRGLSLSRTRGLCRRKTMWDGESETADGDVPSASTPPCTTSVERMIRRVRRPRKKRASNVLPRARGIASLRTRH